MKNSIVIRAATPCDALQIAQLLQGIGWFSCYENGSQEDHAAKLAPLLVPSERQLQLVACDTHGRILAYCAAHWLPLAILQGCEGYLSELFVAQSARGMGIGGQLLEQITAAAQKKGCKRLWLINNRDRDAYQRQFYAQRGWQELPHAARFVRAL